MTLSLESWPSHLKADAPITIAPRLFTILQHSHNFGSFEFWIVSLVSCFAVPTSAPRNVTAYNTSAHSIKVEWIRPDEDRIHGILAGYDVTFTLSHNASAIRRTMICGANTSVVLTNLTVYTLFNITVSAFTKVGIGNRSGLIQARTDETGKYCRNGGRLEKSWVRGWVVWDGVECAWWTRTKFYHCDYLREMQFSLVMQWREKVTLGAFRLVKDQSRGPSEPIN